MTTQITLGGLTVQDAHAEAENLQELGYPLPANFGRANSLLNPLGEQPARGWFLMLRSDLDQLDLNGLHTLEMQDDYDNSIKATNLVLCREPECLTPSDDASDPNACFLVEVADSRWRCHNPYYSVAVNKRYNVRAPGWGGQYYSKTLNGGATWSWTEMLSDLWSAAAGALGGFPGLPAGVSADGIPERYQFLGVSGWRALHQVLNKLGVAVAWNLTSYSLVKIGAADAATQAVLNAAGDRLLFDRQFASIVRGRVPAGVRVHFHRVQEHYGSEPATEQDDTQFITDNVYTVDVDGTASGTDGSYHPLWDDLPAVYDPSGTLLHAADLVTRAQSRATAYFAGIYGDGGNRRRQVYSGLVNLSPSSILRGVCFRQDLQGLTDPEADAAGIVTEVITWPTTQLRVSDNAQFEEALADNTALHPPDLRVKEPVWPDLLQIVRVTATALDGIGAVTGFVQGWNSDTNAWIDRETVKLLPSNGEPMEQKRYGARLIGYDGDKPLYGTLEVGVIAYVVLSAIPPVAPTINLAGGGTANGYAGTYNGGPGTDSRGPCWLLADNNALFTVANYPSAGNTWTPPVAAWYYQARWTGLFDTNHYPIFEIASWHAASWVDNGDLSFTAYAGLVTVTTAAAWNTTMAAGQCFAGDKSIAGNLAVGKRVTGSSAGVGGRFDAVVMWANGPVQVGAANNLGDGTGGYYGLWTTIHSAGNIEVGGYNNGLIAFSTNGQFPTGNPVGVKFNSLPDSQFVTIAASWNGFGANAGLMVGTESILFYGGGGTQVSLFINSNGWLQGLTGSLSDGTQTVSGLVIASSGGKGSTLRTIDGGSFW